MLRASRSLVRRAIATYQLPLSISLGHGRPISTARLDPLIRDFTSELATTQPAFSVSPAFIHVLSKPSEFYQLLLSMIGRAENRIFISSLYIGSKESELLAAIRKALSNKPNLQVYITLDLNRSTRSGSTSAAKSLAPLLLEFTHRVHVSMFRSPRLRGLLAKLVPPRMNEGWGTWHAKFYGADDEVIISGANLNRSYFTNRQDRYLHFSNQGKLAQYCFDFLEVVSGFSYKLNLSRTPSSLGDTPNLCAREDYTLEWPDPHTHPYRSHDKAHKALSAFQQKYRHRSSTDDHPFSTADNDGHNDAILFPMIQAGQFHIREEESVVQLLFRHLQSAASQSRHIRPLIDLTSGYFNLYRPYQNLILQNSNVDCRIVVASPRANGFYGSQGISGRIPEGYTLFERRFMRSVQEAGRAWNEADGGIQMSEWSKLGWTYHAKGLWLSPDARSPPVLTLFGSTNLNPRSANLDAELSFLMVVPSVGSASGSSETPSFGMQLRKSLSREMNDIRANVVDWAGESRSVRLLTRPIAWLVREML